MQPKPRKSMPRRALPNKPLPTRPLPSNPSPSPSPQPSPQPQQIPQQQIPQQQIAQKENVNNDNYNNNNNQNQYTQQQNAANESMQQNINNINDNVDDNNNNNNNNYKSAPEQLQPQTQSEPDVKPEPNVQPEPNQEQEQYNEAISPPSDEQKQAPQQQQQQQEEEQQTVEKEQSDIIPTNNNWYKPRQKPQRSFKAAKTCKLLLDNKKNKIKKVKLFQTYDKFFVAEGNSKNRGFQVASICNNEFGKAFSKMGIDAGWRVTKIDKTQLKMISFPMLKNQLVSIGQKAGDKGYYLIFDGNPPKKEDESKVEDNDGLPSLGNAAPVSLGKNSVELINDYRDTKVLKIKHSLDKYIDFEAVSGPKGYKISGFKAKFGNDLKQFGIDIGWRVCKLGDKDVSNMFTQMIKTNLDVEWRNNKANGIVITFGKPL